MTENEIKFIEENIINFESVELGFVRNIEFPILTIYTEIYQKYLDPQFVLNAWCGHCVWDMLKRLNNYYKSVKPNEQTDVKPKNPRGRKSK